MFQNIVKHVLILFSVWAASFLMWFGPLGEKSMAILPFLTPSYFIKHCSTLYCHDMLNKIEENIMI